MNLLDTYEGLCLWCGLVKTIVTSKSPTASIGCQKERPMKRATATLLFILSAVFTFGQTKQTKKTSTDEQSTRVWHRHVSKDDIDGDHVAYYLPSMEDENVTLLVGCD